LAAGAVLELFATEQAQERHPDLSAAASLIACQSRQSRPRSISYARQFWRSHSSYSWRGFISVILASLDSSVIVATSPWVVRSSRLAMA